MSDEEFTELIADPDVTTVKLTLSGCVEAISQSQLNRMSYRRREVLIRTLSIQDCVRVLAKLNPATRSTHIKRMNPGEYLAIADEVGDEVSHLIGPPGLQVLQGLDALDSASQVRLLAALSDAQQWQIDASYLDALSPVALSEFVTSLSRERLLLVIQHVGKSHVAQMTPDALSKLLATKEPEILIQIIPLLDLAQISVVTASHLSVLNQDQARDMFSKMVADARQKIELKWTSGKVE